MFDTVGSIERLGYLALFATVFVEGFGLPSPGETSIITSGALAAQGTLQLYGVLPVAWAAAVLGDNLGFMIGRFGGRRLVLRFGRHVGLRTHQLQRVEAFFNRYGAWVVILARFVDGPRQLNGIVAGTSGMSWWHFLAANVLGAGLWVGLWGVSGYYLGPHLEPFLKHFNNVQSILLGLLILTFMFAAVALLHRRYRRRDKNRTR